MKKKILVGLGNPGEEYSFTRHNVGFMIVEKLIQEKKGKWRKKDRRFMRAIVEENGSRLVAIKPLTYVNGSGEAVVALGRSEAWEMDELLVICDDFNLPMGALRLRRSGSDGGHNGLKSIIESLGTTAFARLRLGIGPLPEGMDPAEFVLSEFAPEEEPELDKMLVRGVECIRTAVTEGVDRAMTRFNAGWDS